MTRAGVAARRLFLSMCVGTAAGCALSPTEQQQVEAMLTCIECSDGERVPVLALARKWYKRGALRDSLTKALLLGPREMRLGRAQRRMRQHWRTMNDVSPEAPLGDFATYRTTRSSYFETSYRSRAAWALARVYGEEARAALDEAVDSVEVDSLRFAGIRSAVYHARDTILGDGTPRGASATITSTTITLVSGDSQTAAGGSALPAPLVFRVQDGAAAPAPGVTVRFTVDSGGGQLADTLLVTNAGGMVTLSGWRLGTYGRNSLRATSGDQSVAVQAFADPPFPATAFNTSMTGAPGVSPAAPVTRGTAALSIADHSITYRVTVVGVVQVTNVTLFVGDPTATGVPVLELCGQGAAPACGSSGLVTESTSGETFGMAFPQIVEAMRRQDAYVRVAYTRLPPNVVPSSLVMAGKVLSVLP